MTKKRALLCLCVMFMILASIYFFVQMEAIFCPSHVEENLGGRIDILRLCKADYARAFKGRYNEVLLMKDGTQKQVYYGGKPLRSMALSPSRKQVAFYYFPSDQSAEELSLILFDIENGTTRQLYYTRDAFWDVTGDLYWLGNKHLFFLRHCGTSCQGITLLDLNTGETSNAVLTYPSFPNQPEKTRFKDWFGHEFDFDGLVRTVYSETEGENDYLIFALEDYNGTILGEERLLFTMPTTTKQNRTYVNRNI